MTTPLVLQLDDELKRALESEATRRALPVDQMASDLLEEGLRQMRRQRIRTDSARVAHHVACSPDARSLFEDIGGAHSQDSSKGSSGIA